MSSYASPLNTADWSVIAAYFLGMMAVGVWAGRGQKTARDYFLGTEAVPWWGAGLSIVAAETSALTVIGVPAMAYGDDLRFIQMVIGYVIARILLAVVLVPHYFRGEIFSPYQLFANALGSDARRAAGGLFLVSETLAAGVRVYVACIPIQLMLGIAVLPAIVLFVALSLAYTYVGGVKAVIWTDAVQFGWFLLGGIFALTYIPTLVDGGWPSVLAEAGAAGKLRWLDTSFRLGSPFTLWMGLIGGTFVTLSSHGAEQLIVQRVLACQSVRAGRRALVLSAILILPLFLVFLLTGVLLWVYYRHAPFGLPLPEVKPGSGLKANDFIFPIFMLTAVPHWLRGFLVVAILSAAMSSVSSALTALASVSTMDFVKPVRPAWGDTRLLRFSRNSTVVWALALMAVAYLSRGVTFVLNAAFALRGLTSGALLGGLILALGFRRLGSRAVIAGMGVAVATMTAIQVLPKWPVTAPAWKYWIGTEIFWPWYTLIGTAITLATAWLVSRIAEAKPARGEAGQSV